ncbi:MAG: DUF58 domain-containing protein [Kofleriaceae bacterium]|nr:DUF58 domain-containing protein [Kofleriaceae bacterium]
MTPSLAKRGKLILASATSFIVVGALNASAPLIAIGGAVIISFLAAYLWFFPAAIVLRRRMVELSWWMPPGELPGGACSANLPLPLHIALRNHGGRRLRVLKLDVLSTTALETPKGLEAVMRAGMQVEIVGQVYARQPGYHVIHGATLHFGDILGLFTLSAYFPNPLPFKVFPRVAEFAGNPEQPVQGGTLHQRQGLHQVRRRGLAGELRELREHQHGDPFKNIAWKATARKRKLMVRELENEIVLTHQFILDIGGGMRTGKPGQRKLDYAIHLIANLAKSALDAGDRVGMVTFDSRVYSRVPPGEGRHQYLKIIDRLVEANTIVDEDLTELTNSELVAAIATYLAHQEAVDLRILDAPALDSAAWSEIQAGPNGELYDLNALERIITGLLGSMSSSRKKKRLKLPEWWTKIHVSSGSSPLMADLRLFARMRGIELPYRVDHEFGRRSKGLDEALRQVRMGSRADSIVLVSDMNGIQDASDGDLQELARARAGRRKIVSLVPYGPNFSEVVFSKPGQIIAEILEQEEDAKLSRMRSMLTKKGIPMLVLGPGDGVSSVSQRISRSGSGRRRVA